MTELNVEVTGIDQGHVADVERRLRCREIRVSHQEAAGGVRFNVQGPSGPQELEACVRRVMRRSLGRAPKASCTTV